MADLTSQTIGHYHILGRLGKGAMGTVYRATDSQTGQEVAIKIISSELAIDPEMLERFKREGEALSKLKHPNIVGYLDAFQHDENYVIVMEYVAGGSLYDLIKSEPLPIDRARQIALDLCDALIRAHRLNIIHRDIKPENVLLAEDGTPKLADFGVARLTEGTRMTKSGTQVGTPYYMAPEAWEGKPLDGQADIWSLGTILFEMLTGQVPFAGETPVAVMTRVHTASLPDLRKLRPETPANLIKITRRMITRDKGKRYQTVREVAVDLERELTITARKSLPKTQIVANPAKRFPLSSRLPGLLIAGSAIAVTAMVAFQYSTNRLNNISAVTTTPVFTSTSALEQVETESAEATFPPTSTRGPTNTPSVTPSPIYVEGTVLFEEDFESRDPGRIFGWNFGSYILGISNPGQYWNVLEESDGNRLLSANIPETDESGFTFGSKDWTNYVVKFRVKITERGSKDNSGIEITVRGSSEAGCPLGYHFSIGDFWNGMGSTGPILTSGICQTRHLVDAPRKGVEINHWYEVRVESYDSSIYFVVDNIPIHKVINESSPTGNIGFNVNSGVQVVFDDISVVELVAR